MTLKEIMATEEYHTRSSSSVAAKYDSKLAMATDRGYCVGDVSSCVLVAGRLNFPPSI
jgi:hypothetical protein